MVSSRTMHKTIINSVRRLLISVMKDVITSYGRVRGSWYQYCSSAYIYKTTDVREDALDVLLRDRNGLCVVGEEIKLDEIYVMMVLLFHVYS